MSQPLSHLRVLDLTHVLAGPFCTYLLAVHGAEVIKIEPPDAPDCVRGRGPDKALNAQLMGINYLTQASNKRAMTLDLKTDEGRHIFRGLARAADVVVENYRAGALAALGLGAASLTAENPRLIHCSLTGFGQTGPHAHVNAYDNVIQAVSGLMAMSGPDAATPTKSGASVVDYASGLAASLAITLALVQRAQTGRGCVIDCAMLDMALMLMGTQVTSHYAGAPPPKAKGNNGGESGLGCYDAADGKLMLGAFNAAQHRRLWLALDRPDFAGYSSWDDMHAHADEMRAVLRDAFVGRTVADLEGWLHGIGVPAERVRSIDDGIALAELQQRAVTAETTLRDSSDRPVRVPLAPFSLSEGTAALRSAPPRVGEHTDEILREQGWSDAAIASLRNKGVI